jgi:hypothetical protein
LEGSPGFSPCRMIITASGNGELGVLMVVVLSLRGTCCLGELPIINARNCSRNHHGPRHSTGQKTLVTPINRSKIAPQKTQHSQNFPKARL